MLLVKMLSLQVNILFVSFFTYNPEPKTYNLLCQLVNIRQISSQSVVV